MKTFTHRFVEEMPRTLEQGIVYVSLEYNTVTHLCACGCGSETVTPLGKTEWRLTYDGEAISLSPSVGNWSLPCRSHYVLEDGIVHWADSWTDEEVEAGRRADRVLKARMGARTDDERPTTFEPAAVPSRTKRSIAARFKEWWNGRRG